MTRTRLAIVGFGKIARDQHVPAIAGSEAFELVALVDPAGSGNVALPCFADLDALLRDGPAIDAVVLCQPPAARFDAAAGALAAGLDVFLEKPPGLAPGEVDLLAQMADDAGQVLFTAWHSREAAMIDATRAILAAHPPRRVRIEWREDVRKWHPGQDWLLARGGFGAFDPGINALSILTVLVAGSCRVVSARFDRPANRAMPIAARMALQIGADRLPVDVTLDIDAPGDETWQIEVATDVATLLLNRGGDELHWQGEVRSSGGREYARLYAAFANAVAMRRSAVDISPLRIVADAFLAAEWREVPGFDWT